MNAEFTTAAAAMTIHVGQSGVNPTYYIRRTELLHQTMNIGHAPLFDNLAANYPKNGDLLNAYPPARGRKAREFASLRAGGGESYHYSVTFGDDIIHLFVPVGE